MNWTSPPDSAWVFFVDRCLGRKAVPSALRDVGASVRTHDESFPPDCPDAEWLSVAGREQWVVITSDKRIRYRLNECEALLKARVRAFVLTSNKNLSGREIGACFVRALPEMQAFLKRHPAPFIAHVWKDGTVKLMRTV